MARVTISSLWNEIEGLKKELEKAIANRDYYLGNCNKANSALAVKTRENEVLTTQRDFWSEKFVSLKKKLDEKTEQIEGLTRWLEKAERRAENLQDNVYRSEESIEALEERLEHSEERYDKLLEKVLNRVNREKRSKE